MGSGNAKTDRGDHATVPLKPIYVTKTALPPLADYVRHLRQIWASGHITNHGPMVTELERRLAEATGMKHAMAVCSGSIGLHIAVRALGLERSEVITTAFSYVATSATLAWEGCFVRFADVLPGDFTIDPEAVDRMISPATRGIVATHVYGHPCDVDAIAAIARRHGIRVLYDAAHCWGVRYRQRSLFQHGDISVLSMHATKVLHSAEGGVLFTNDDSLAERIRHLRNFGHKDYEAFWGLGTNGKMSELHAALGLCMLDRVDRLTERLRNAAAAYDRAFDSQVRITRPAPRAGTERNWTYYPILLESEEAVKNVQARLETFGIFARRYFYPPLTRLPYFRNASAPRAEAFSRRVLCLPLSTELSEADAARIAAIISETLANHSGA